METRAHHLLIGTFVLLLVAGLFGFIIWLARVDLDAEYKRYDIFFEGSIAGLNEGASVQLNGVPVGKVLDISIPRERPSQVHVLIRVEEDVPILEGTVARLELQGFTGVAYLQLSGGKQGNPPITSEEDQPRPVIPSEPSPIQKVFAEAPNLLNEAVLALNQVKQLFNEENRQAVTNILANTETITASFAASASDLEALLKSLDDAVIAFEKTMDAYTQVAGTIDDTVDTEIRAAFAEADDALADAEMLMENMNGLVDENRPAVTQFLNSTLPEASRLVADLRRLTIRVNQVVEQFEERPQEMLFGKQKPEYVPQEQR